MTERDKSADKIDQLHAEAVARGDEYYIDPISGFLVMTALFHQARGNCCDSNCRHCPYK